MIPQRDEIDRLEEALAAEMRLSGEYRDRMTRLAKARVQRDAIIHDRQAAIAWLQGELSAEKLAREALADQLDEILRSRGWRWLMRYRRAKARLFGPRPLHVAPRAPQPAPEAPSRAPQRAAVSPPDSQPRDPDSVRIARSVVSMGSTARLQRVMAKARAGRPIMVGAIGGSITAGCAATTEGGRWVNRVADWWRASFPQSDVEHVNAGIGCTGSDIGVHRVRRHLLVHQPDIVVIEYAVNDTINPIAAETL
jgi:hypothetical protein